MERSDDYTMTASKLITKGAYAIIKVLMVAIKRKLSINKEVAMTSVDKKKFEELVLYVSKKSTDDTQFGSIKLNKIIAFADMVHFSRTGHSITGASYMKQKLGVVARNMKPTLVELEKKHELALIPTDRYGNIAKVPTAIREADINIFKASEIEAVDSMIDVFKEQNGTRASKLSHFITPNWEYLPIGGDIPISSLLYPREYKMTPEEEGHFKQLLRETDWGQKVINLSASAA